MSEAGFGDKCVPKLELGKEGSWGRREAAEVGPGVAAVRFVARLQTLYVQITRPSARRIRLFPEFRRSLAGSGARGEAPRNRFLRLRARGVGRGTVRDRAHGREGFLGEKRRHGHRHRSPGAAGLGRVRDRLLHSLFRLQRHLSLEGTGAPERQHCRVSRGRGERRREWARADHGDRARLRGAMPFLRRREHSCARLGSSDLWRVFDGTGSGALDEARCREDAPRGEHRGRELRGVPAGAGGGVVALEGRGLRERGALRGLRGAARARGHDRSGADF